MFVKYNSVLRGLQSSSDFLKDTMVQLCCSKDVAEQYAKASKGKLAAAAAATAASGSAAAAGSAASATTAAAAVSASAAAAVAFEEAKSSLNQYTTTLHGINSAIIKLGKLTKATKVPCSLPSPLLLLWPLAWMPCGCIL